MGKNSNENLFSSYLKGESNLLILLVVFVFLNWSWVLLIIENYKYER